MHGITVDDADNPRKLPAIVAAIGQLTVAPTTRIVFDPDIAASEYLPATIQIASVSNIMGEPVDSFDMAAYTPQNYLLRFQDYVNTLGNDVDIWEVGNEVNGDWVGPTSDVATKIASAFDYVKSQGGVTALTLYDFGPASLGCLPDAQHEMFTWAIANIPDRMKQGLDYVWVSQYPDNCSGYRPDWPAVFQQLATIFPNSKLGVGETGIHQSLRARYIPQIYDMKIPTPSYVGGGFWWAFSEEMVPDHKPLWRVINHAMLLQPN